MTSSFSVNASVTTLDPLFENSTLAAIQLARNALESYWSLCHSTIQLVWLAATSPKMLLFLRLSKIQVLSGHFEFIFAVSPIYPSLSDITLVIYIGLLCVLLLKQHPRPAAISLVYSLIL